MHERVFVVDFAPRLIRKHTEKQFGTRFEFALHGALPHLSDNSLARKHGRRVRHQVFKTVAVFHLSERRRERGNRGNNFLYHRAGRVEGAHPFRYIDPHRRKRKLRQHRLHDFAHIVGVHVFHVHGDNRDVVFAAQRVSQSDCLVGRRIAAVKHDDKGFAEVFEFVYDPFFRGDIGGTRQFGYAAVVCHHHRYCGVLRHDFSGAQFGSLLERHFFFRPRRGDKPGFSVFVGAHGAVHHITHAVYKAHVDAAVIFKAYRHALSRHEFRLGGHNGFAVGGLRKFIHRPGARVFVFHVRQHQRLHKPGHEGGFSRSYRADDADINIAVCPLGNVAVYIKIIHRHFPP